MGLWAKFLRKSLESGYAEYLRHWYLVVGEYSKRSLTFKDDRLPALEGLVSTYEQVTQRSVVGL